MPFFCTQIPIQSRLQNWFLVEFESPESVNRAFLNGLHDDSSGIPITSPFMWLASDKQLKKNNALPRYYPSDLPMIDDTQRQDKQRKQQKLNLDNQILSLYDDMKMSDTSVRLRFLACEQVEQALSGMFKQIEVLPFGSSVNSYGTLDSDLDMVASFKGAKIGVQKVENVA